MTEDEEDGDDSDSDDDISSGPEEQHPLLLSVIGPSSSTNTTIETSSTATTSQKSTSPMTRRRKKLFYAILFGVVCTCRAGLNIASTKYAVSYYITTINSFTPILTSIADSYLLGTKLPCSLWICIFTTCCGCIFIAISQKYEIEKQQNQNRQQDEEESTTTMIGGGGGGGGGDTSSASSSESTTILFGCFLQLLSICFSAMARILMKYTDGILSKIEIVQANNICNVILPFLYTLLTNPMGWIAFEYILIPNNLIAFVTVSIVVYTIGSTTQVTLVRNVGPAIYTSFNGIRIICSAILSALLVHESISNTIELLGLCIIIISMTMYTWDLRQ